jgi:hypothetical protein
MPLGRSRKLASPGELLFSVGFDVGPARRRWRKDRRGYRASLLSRANHTAWSRVSSTGCVKPILRRMFGQGRGHGSDRNGGWMIPLRCLDNALGRRVFKALDFWTFGPKSPFRAKSCFCYCLADQGLWLSHVSKSGMVQKAAFLGNSAHSERCCSRPKLLRRFSFGKNVRSRAFPASGGGAGWSAIPQGSCPRVRNVRCVGSGDG